MNIAFFGTGDFSKNILKWIMENFKNINVKLVVSQPDKPVWRKKELMETPLKSFAIKNNIEVVQPEKLKLNETFFEKLKNLNLDFVVVVAYWKIIPKDILTIPNYWCINIHGSILPKYRWASPIQESIKNWDKKTWLTIMYMSEWMDEWDILDIKEINIDILDTTKDIFSKFEKIWPSLLINTLEKIVSWEIKWIKQNDNDATYCSKIEKKDWEISFNNYSAKEIYNKYKAYIEWPWIYTYYKWKKISIENCFYYEIDLSYDDELKNWDVIEIENEHDWKEKEVWIICKNWILIIKEVKLEWKKTMDIKTFINWNKDFLEYNFC